MAAAAHRSPLLTTPRECCVGFVGTRGNDRDRIQHIWGVCMGEAVPVVRARSVLLRQGAVGLTRKPRSVDALVLLSFQRRPRILLGYSWRRPTPCVTLLRGACRLGRYELQKDIASLVGVAWALVASPRLRRVLVPGRFRRQQPRPLPLLRAGTGLSRARRGLGILGTLPDRVRQVKISKGVLRFEGEGDDMRPMMEICRRLDESAMARFVKEFSPTVFVPCGAFVPYLRGGYEGSSQLFSTCGKIV